MNSVSGGRPLTAAPPPPTPPPTPAAAPPASCSTPAPQKSRLKSVSREHPCPVCGGDHKCSVGDDGVILCGRRQGEQPGFACLGPARGDPQWCLYRRADDPERAARSAKHTNGQPQRYYFSYPAERGQELYQVVRTEPGKNGKSKDICQRRPDGKGGWVYSLGDVRRVPYHLPELLGADRGSNVFVAEGEKKVDALRRWGLLATCNPQGAGKWGKLDPQAAEAALREQHVFLLPDNDVDGRKHVQDVARRTQSYAASVAIVELPGLGPKGDIIDWIAAGGTKEELLRLAQAAPKESEHGDAWEPPGSVPPFPPRSGNGNGVCSAVPGTAGTAGTESVPPFPPKGGGNGGTDFPDPIPATGLSAEGQGTSWVWDGYIAAGSTTLLSALWKVGKTTLLTHLLRARQEGNVFCGRAVASGRTLYVTEESQRRWVERRDQLGLTDAAHFQVRPFRGKPNRGEWLLFLDHLDRQLAAGGYDFVVFDTLSNLWPVRDENDAAQVQEALMPLHRLCERGAALLLVHHLRKSDGTEATASRGSGALPAFVDTIVELRRFAPDHAADRRRVLTAVGRWEETPAELVVELTEADGYAPQGERQDAQAADLRRVIEAALPNGPPGATVDEIKEALPEGSRRQKLISVLQDGAGKGWWNRTGAGKAGNPFRFWASLTSGNQGDDW